MAAKCKIFFGNMFEYADDKYNTWIEENPKVYIASFAYVGGDHAEHAICITYFDKNPFDICPPVEEE